jgi:hypothetical protein
LKSQISDPPPPNRAADAFMDTARSYALNNVYLSIGAPSSALLSAKGELPQFLSRLNGNAIFPEALIDSDPTEWTCDGTVRNVQRVAAYNGEAKDGQGFRGIHIDIEPRQHTNKDTSWFEPLVDCYARVRNSPESAGMPVVADFAGSKARLLSDDERQRMLNAVTRLVLMQYEFGADQTEEERIKSIVQRTREFMHGVHVVPRGDEVRGVIVGIRLKDFPGATDSAYFAQQVATPLDVQLANQEGYLGWAIFKHEQGTTN